ncbi:hypothetical protein, partial [Pseudoalteromonas piscicida]|uniref:hypothetical protein n=1 Tax=Pseudoalteromonas piscicida TaxID=43662 RepID=UPI003C7D0E95
SEECFDRVGERAKLLNSIRAGTNLCYVSGRSGVGKSHIISSVLYSQYGNESVVKYEFGRNPISLTRFLLVCALEHQPIGSKFLQSIKNIRLSEISINIPMVGKAPLKWGGGRLELDKQSLPLKDILREIDGPIYISTTREVRRLSTLLSRTKFKIIWISNIECAKENEIGLIFLIIKYISPSVTVVVEGAHAEKYIKIFKEKFSELCISNNLKLSEHKIKPFSECFAKGLFNFLRLKEKGLTFNYKNNLGYPVAIEFDLNEGSKNKELGVKLDSCFHHSENTNNTLLLLGLLFATENRYSHIINLAESMGVELSLSKPIESGVVKLTDNICELSHPQIARYISLTKKQDIYRMIKLYYQKSSKGNPIEIDLAAMSYIESFDVGIKLKLLNRGIEYILENIGKNKISESEQVLNCIEEGVDSLTSEQLSEPMISRACDSISLLRLQLNGLQCRLSGVSPHSETKVVELLILAQARMKQIDLQGAIALTEAVITKLKILNISKGLYDWLFFCSTYIKLSCLIALGNFIDYKEEYIKLRNRIVGWKGKPLSLFSLLPKYDLKEWEVKIDVIDCYLSARYNNNKACYKMITDVTNKEISLALKKSIDTVAREGSMEVTFPINNYALHAAYNSNIDESIDALFNMIDHCTYPYDYFSAYNNIAIVLAMKGSLDQAAEFCEKAHKYIEGGVLTDPVFEIKSYFNKAVIKHFLGEKDSWSEFKLIKFEFNRLPSRYFDLLSKKIAYIDENLGNKEILRVVRNNNIELGSALWPQNLQFWDFMYPVITHENIDEIIDSDLYIG